MEELLAYLDKNVGGDNYKVFDWEELNAVSEDARAQIGTLKTNGYAVVKYSDEREVCLCLTANGRAAAQRARQTREAEEAAEQTAPQAAAKPSLWQRARTAVTAAIAGLFGGVIGGAVIYLILSVAA